MAERLTTQPTPAIDDDQQTHDSGLAPQYVTQNEAGGIFVFDEPLGANVAMMDGKQVFFELDADESQRALEMIREALRSDVKDGKTWKDFGGLVVNLPVLRALLQLGVVTKEQVVLSKVDSETKKLTTDFSASQFYKIFSGGSEKLVPDTHPFYRRKLIIMDPQTIKQVYGDEYTFVTVDHEEKML